MIDFRQPFAVGDAGAARLREMALNPMALKAREGEPLPSSPGVEMRGTVAVLKAHGLLLRYAADAMWCGGTSYGSLRKQLQAAVDDSRVKSIVFDIDSHGGEINGLVELGDSIRDARAKKPVTAYVGGSATSAAYLLAASCGDIVCAATSILGSVGVRVVLHDDSKAMSDAGLKEYEIVSSQSPRKAQQVSDSDYRSRVQQRIDDLADVMVAAIAKGRGVRAQTVLANYGAGDALVGKKAVDAGLADRIGDFEGVVAALAKQISTPAFMRPTAALTRTTAAASSGKEIQMSKVEKRAA